MSFKRLLLIHISSNTPIFKHVHMIFNHLPPPPREKDGHLYWLDIIRFLAAFAVMASHFRGAFFEEYSNLPLSQQNIFSFLFYAVTRLGFEAVLIFFVLSGLLVGGKTILRIKNNSFSGKDYIIDRSVRIMLPLISSLLLFLPIALHYNISPSVWSWIGNLLSLQGILTTPVFETLWSLSYEVWFYIIMYGLACIILSCQRHNITKYKIGIVIIGISMLVFLKLRIDYLFIWFLGAFAFIIRPKLNKFVLGLSFAISMIILFLLQMTSGSHFIGNGQAENQLLRPILIIFFGLGFAFFLQQIIYYKPKSDFCIRINTIGTKLAAFSYTLYLTHIPVLIFLQHIGAPKCPSLSLTSVCLYLLWMLIALGVAYLLYLIFEKNTPIVKKYIKEICLKVTSSNRNEIIKNSL